MDKSQKRLRYLCLVSHVKYVNSHPQIILHLAKVPVFKCQKMAPWAPKSKNRFTLLKGQKLSSGCHSILFWMVQFFGIYLRYYRPKTYQKIKVIWVTFFIWNTLNTVFHKFSKGNFITGDFTINGLVNVLSNSPSLEEQVLLFSSAFVKVSLI